MLRTRVRMRVSMLTHKSVTRALFVCAENVHECVVAALLSLYAFAATLSRWCWCFVVGACCVMLVALSIDYVQGYACLSMHMCLKHCYASLAELRS